MQQADRPNAPPNAPPKLHPPPAIIHPPNGRPLETDANATFVAPTSEIFSKTKLIPIFVFVENFGVGKHYNKAGSVDDDDRNAQQRQWRWLCRHFHGESPYEPLEPSRKATPIPQFAPLEALLVRLRLRICNFRLQASKVGGWRDWMVGWLGWAGRKDRTLQCQYICNGPNRTEPKTGPDRTGPSRKVF